MKESREKYKQKVFLSYNLMFVQVWHCSWLKGQVIGHSVLVGEAISHLLANLAHQQWKSRTYAQYFTGFLKSDKKLGTVCHMKLYCVHTLESLKMVLCVISQHGRIVLPLIAILWHC